MEGISLDLTRLVGYIPFARLSRDMQEHFTGLCAFQAEFRIDRSSTSHDRYR